jgi:hypothetical protein
MIWITAIVMPREFRDSIYSGRREISANGMNN